MLPPDLKKKLQREIKACEHPREKTVDVMYAVQRHYGYLTDEGLNEAAEILGMTPLEVEELATFYDFIYRSPVGKFVIHVCDSVVCWLCHEDWDCIGQEESLTPYICDRLGVNVGEVSSDGLFTVLPSACIGYCEYAPAILVNGVPYGPLTPAKLDEIIQSLRENRDMSELVMDR